MSAASDCPVSRLPYPESLRATLFADTILPVRLKTTMASYSDRSSIWGCPAVVFRIGSELLRTCRTVRLPSYGAHEYYARLLSVMQALDFRVACTTFCTKLPPGHNV